MSEINLIINTARAVARGERTFNRAFHETSPVLHILPTSPYLSADLFSDMCLIKWNLTCVVQSSHRLKFPEVHAQSWAARCCFCKKFSIIPELQWPNYCCFLYQAEDVQLVSCCDEHAGFAGTKWPARRQERTRISSGAVRRWEPRRSRRRDAALSRLSPDPHSSLSAALSVSTAHFPPRFSSPCRDCSEDLAHRNRPEVHFQRLYTRLNLIIPTTRSGSPPSPFSVPSFCHLIGAIGEGVEGAGGGARGRSQGIYVLFRRATIWKAIGVFMCSHFPHKTH